MTATGHAVLGAVIAAKIANPFLAIPLAIVSHFAADIFPHWDTGTNHRKKSNEKFFVESLLDVVFSFIVAYSLLIWLFPQTNFLYAFIIILISQLPDWITAPYIFFKIKSPIFLICYNFQHRFNNRLDKPWGIITQIAVLSLITFLAKIF